MKAKETGSRKYKAILLCLQTFAGLITGIVRPEKCIRWKVRLLLKDIASRSNQYGLHLIHYNATSYVQKMLYFHLSESISE